MLFKNGAAPEFVIEHYSTIVLEPKSPKEPNKLLWEAHSQRPCTKPEQSSLPYDPNPTSRAAVG